MTRKDSNTSFFLLSVVILGVSTRTKEVLRTQDVYYGPLECPGPIRPGVSTRVDRDPGLTQIRVIPKKYFSFQNKLFACVLSPNDSLRLTHD